VSVRYVLAPEAARDLVEIWRYIKSQSNIEVADRAESVIRERIGFLAKTPGAGHWSRHLTDEPVRFFAVYSYLLAYLPETKPLQVVAILHGPGTYNEFPKSVSSGIR
jgi:plasmid stabilization system protein ParE